MIGKSIYLPVVLYVGPSISKKEAGKVIPHGRPKSGGLLKDGRL